MIGPRRRDRRAPYCRIAVTDWDLPSLFGIQGEIRKEYRSSRPLYPFRILREGFQINRLFECPPHTLRRKDGFHAAVNSAIAETNFHAIGSVMTILNTNL